MVLEPMKPRSTRYFRLSLGPRKPVLDRRRHEDDGWMNEQMIEQTNDHNYRLMWTEWKRLRDGGRVDSAEVRWTWQINRYMGRVEKGSEESHLLIKTLYYVLCMLSFHGHVYDFAAMLVNSIVCFLPCALVCWAMTAGKRQLFLGFSDLQASSTNKYKYINK